MHSHPVHSSSGPRVATWYSMQLMTVICPAGVYAGGQIQIHGPGGGLFHLTVPAGVGPGQQFQVQIASAPPAQVPTAMPTQASHTRVPAMYAQTQPQPQPQYLHRDHAQLPVAPPRPPDPAWGMPHGNAVLQVAPLYPNRGESGVTQVEGMWCDTGNSPRHFI